MYLNTMAGCHGTVLLELQASGCLEGESKRDMVTVTVKGNPNFNINITDLASSLSLAINLRLQNLTPPRTITTWMTSTCLPAKPQLALPPSHKMGVLGQTARVVPRMTVSACA
jgi:hypothetical protein